ncbi:MAG: lectin [Pseudoxanthomonas sp.]|nr:lectin [Pseudoxanthomonas sp.]
MRPSFALTLLFFGTLAQVACKPTPAQLDVAPAVAGSPAAPQAPSGTASAAPEVVTPDVRFFGYGNMELGSTVEEARAAWGGELLGGPVEGGNCYFLYPEFAANSRALGFMIEDGRFVRYDVRTDFQQAPGGALVGMDGPALNALYTTMLQAAPHKYVPGGQTLTLEGGAGVDSRLVLETDAAGKVTRWRIGLPPQVDYVEGCS